MGNFKIKKTGNFKIKLTSLKNHIKLLCKGIKTLINIFYTFLYPVLYNLDAF